MDCLSCVALRVGPFLLAAVAATATIAGTADLVKISSGTLEGTVAADPSVRLFKGVPFAAPPVGDLRWKAPQPVAPWPGLRKADEWGNHCMQGLVWDDILPRGKAASEDCLNLNVWTPAKSRDDKLPVYLWFYGGGFAVGASSEPRYDGEYLARQGIVVVEPNYRLGVFGFLAHPELTKESGHGASGNYGLLDQVAALRWVRENIAAFGGDPNNVTIGGESAGSASVGGLMASPLSKGLFHKAIGESGAFFPSPSRSMDAGSLVEAERAGVQFASSVGAASLADLRAKKADELLTATMKANPFLFGPIVDGHFLPAPVPAIYARGEQARVPLLAGWNSSELSSAVAMAQDKPTPAVFADTLRQQFKDHAQAASQLYPASTQEETLQSAADLAGDQFIAYSTWKWIEMQTRTGQVPVYRYQFDRVAPDPSGANRFGAVHASEIQYAFGTLDSKQANWQPEDRKTSLTMAAYWANFIKTGNPNGPGLASWPEFGKAREVMHIDAASKAAPERHRARYELLDSLTGR
jgi:para-nitrobenzyl esterase